jgi:hypothetical protein
VSAHKSCDENHFSVVANHADSRRNVMLYG